MSNFKSHLKQRHAPINLQTPTQACLEPQSTQIGDLSDPRNTQLENTSPVEIGKRT